MCVGNCSKIRTVYDGHFFKEPENVRPLGKGKRLGEAGRKRKGTEHGNGGEQDQVTMNACMETLW